MTTTDEDCIRAIVREPDDDFVRLAYSDFLEESGQVYRAEFIRVQVELAGCFDRDEDGPRQNDLRRREQELMSRPACRWWCDYGPGYRFTVLAWRRGFPDGLACRTGDWLEHGPGLVRTLPLRTLRLTDFREANRPTGFRREYEGQSLWWYWPDRSVERWFYRFHEDQLLCDRSHDGRGVLAREALMKVTEMVRYRTYLLQFTTEELALANVETACLEWAKAQPAP